MCVGQQRLIQAITIAGCRHGERSLATFTCSLHIALEGPSLRDTCMHTRVIFACAVLSVCVCVCFHARFYALRLRQIVGGP